MITSTSAPPAGLLRCAVCKIDLRGRFVYVDDETEALLGRPREELFGKPIADFLDRGSHDVIDHILAERKHYETHFDFAPLSVIHKDSRPHPVDATISLCFNGGNPVNYQFVLRPHGGDRQAVYEIEPGMSTEEFLSSYLTLATPGPTRELTNLFAVFTEAEQVAIYLITENRLEPRAGAGRDTTAGFAFDAIPETTELHEQVAQTDEEYAATDQKTAIAAIQSFGAAPPEYVTGLTFGNGERYLLRLILGYDTPLDMKERSVSRARLACRLVERISSIGPGDSNHDDPQVDVRFTIGFLTSLGIGAFLADSEGNIVGYNPVMTEILKGVEPGETCHEFVELIDQGSGAGLADLIDNSAAQTDDDIKIHLTLPSGDPCLLVVVRLAMEENDQSACWVLIPHQTGFVSTGDGDRQPAADSILRGLKPVLDEVTTSAVQLSRDYCRQVDQLDELELGRLHGAARTMEEMLECSSLLHTESDFDDFAPVDMNALVAQAVEHVRGEFPQLTIDCNHSDLPPIKSSPARLIALLRNLMANCVRHNREDEVTIVVEAEIVGQKGLITVSDNGAGIPKGELNRLFDFYRPPNSDGAPRRSGGPGLGVSREIVKSLGGTIEVTSKPGQGARLVIVLPQSAPNRG